jgi:hypothetical protein
MRGLAIAALALAGPKAAAERAPGVLAPPAELKAYLESEAQDGAADDPEPLRSWRASLDAALRRGGRDAALAALTPASGLTREQMSRLVQLWLESEADNATTDESQRVGRYAALAAESGRAPLVLSVAAAAMKLDCDQGRFDALMAGARDRVTEAWTLAQAADCTDWYRRFIALAGPRAGPALVRLLGSEDMERAEKLPLAAWLASEAGLAHVREADRAAVRLRIRHALLAALLGAGLRTEALTLVDALSAADRAAVIDGPFPRLETEMDGLPLLLPAHSDEKQGLREDLAAALALAGRRAEAETLFAGLTNLAEARQRLACQTAIEATTARVCRNPWSSDDLVLLLDYFLHRPTEDPYLIAESRGASSLGADEGVGSELFCRVFADPGYKPLCTAARNRARRMNQLEAEHEDAARATARQLDSAGFAELAELRAHYATALGLDAQPVAPSWRGTTVVPAPSPFEARPLPGGPGRPATPVKLTGLALPQGYSPVRAERSGQRLVVVSLSQNYDPTGEVSGGGYWVHLSQDGGRTFERPLYTGLAQYFPYEVEEASPLPMIDGDALDLAVRVRELDTASITYPPVGLRMRREQKGLYLHIPLAELRRDSDGDGLTDIAAHHLLLDRPPGSRPTLLARTDGYQCEGTDAAEREALAAVLGQVLHLSARAIVEPVDRPRGELLADLKGAAAGADQPIFISGDSAAFRCIAIDRLAIVYSDSELERLRTMTPDFHAVEFGPLILNRAHDRGFMTWSTGWAGGTVRVRRTGAAWRVDTIGSWIT